MEFVDGEGTPAARAGIEAHVTACPSCQALVAQQRGLSRDLAAWHVAPAPGSLRPPHEVKAGWLRPWFSPWRVAAVSLSLAAVLIVPVYLTRVTPKPALALASADQRGRAAGLNEVPANQEFVAGSALQPPLAAATRADAPQIPHGPAVIRTVALQIIAKDFTQVRSAVEAILDGSGGFADQLAVSADPGSARVLRGSLRVPGTQLTDVLGRLRALGQVTQDQQSAQDVADQLVDLDARLKSARATEQRLIDLLKNRTGKLSDVLEVEQELTRVRLDIERLDAEKTNMTRRVTYATIDLTVSEARKAGLDSGPLPLLTQLRIAAADGLQNVVDAVVGLTLFALRAGPSLVLWGSAALAIWIVVKRMRRSYSA